MSIIVMIVLGALVGWIAASLMGRDEGFIASMLIGVVGSFIGGFVSTMVTGGDKAILAFSWSGLFWSLVGSVILVGIMNAFSRRQHHHA